jgi:hypothetical protein
MRGHSQHERLELLDLRKDPSRSSFGAVYWNLSYLELCLACVAGGPTYDSAQQLSNL